MIIKGFLDQIMDDIGASDDIELRKKLLVKISNIEDEILEVTDAITKTFKVLIPSDQIIRLPYDFKSPKAVFSNSTELTRVDKHVADNLVDSSVIDTNNYSVDLLRVPPAIDKPLRLRASYFEYAKIETRRSMDSSGWGFKIMNNDGTIILGEVTDNKNIWYPQNLNDDTLNNIKIKILDATDDPAVYDDAEDLRDEDLFIFSTVYGVYKIELKEGIKEYYLNENAFSYSDLARTTLLTRGSFEGNNQYLNLGSGREVGEEITVEYLAGAQNYISEMQNNILLDKFRNLMYQGMIWKAYETLKKTRQANIERDKYYIALKESDSIAGKMNNFNKIRKFRPAENANRLPWMY